MKYTITIVEHVNGVESGEKWQTVMTDEEAEKKGVKASQYVPYKKDIKIQNKIYEQTTSEEIDLVSIINAFNGVTTQ